MIGPSVQRHKHEAQKNSFIETTKELECYSHFYLFKYMNVFT